MLPVSRPQGRNKAPDLSELTLALQAQTRRINELVSLQDKILDHLVALANAVDEMAKGIPKPRAKRKPVKAADRPPLTKGRSPKRLTAKKETALVDQAGQENRPTGEAQ